MRIAIIAALPGELKPLVSKGFKVASVQQRYARKWNMSMGDDVWIAVCAGMGADAARRAFAEAECEGPIGLMLSVGWAGALTNDLAAGATYIPTAVVDAQTGERYDLAHGCREDLILVSTVRVAPQPEKLRLAATYRASLADMESAALVRLGEARGIPVCCLKAVSDDLGEALPDFNLFTDSMGQMRMRAFLLHVLLRPRHWPALVRLGRASKRGAQTLAGAIFTFLTGPHDANQLNRTGNVDW